ncbi:MAG TPA: hypothetical protein VIH57_21360 [Bacteroidales bacterium]
MTLAQEQKLATYLKFQEHLSQNPEALENYPHLKPLYEVFNQRLSLIIKTKQMLDDCVQNKALRDDLINVAASLSRKITSFALLEDITELQGLGFSTHELTENDDLHLLKICETLLCKCEDFLNDLADYGINDVALKEFRDQTDQFKTSVYNKEMSNNLVNQTFNEFSNLFKETDEIFEGKLDTIITENSSKQ